MLRLADMLDEGRGVAAESSAAAAAWRAKAGE
jgi:hypothetical protein